MSDIARNTFNIQATNNLATDEIHEEMAQMRIERGLVLKRVDEGAEKVNALNYLMRPPPSVEEYYYEEDVYAMDD